MFTLEGVANLFVALGNFSWADATRERDGYSRPHIDQVGVDHEIQTIVQNIGSTAFEFAYEVGRTIELKNAITYTLANWKS